MTLRLRRALDAKGIYVKDCATLLGVTEKTLNNKISGRTDFTIPESRTLKTILPEYDIDYLLSEDTEFRAIQGGTQTK